MNSALSDGDFMKLVVFADLHLDAPFAMFGKNGEAARNKRRQLRRTLQHIASLANEEAADGLLCAGDLFENDTITPDTCSFLRDTFGDLGSMPVLLAPGNHDWIGPQSPYLQIDWSPNVHVFTADQLTPHELIPGVLIWGAGFQGPTRASGFIDGFSVPDDDLHIGLFHGSETGGFPIEDGKQPHAPFTATQIEESGLAHAFVGHYHRPRLADYLTYPGNPEPLSFGEEGIRGAVVAEFSEQGLERRTVRVASCRTSEIRLDVTGLTGSEQVLQRAKELLATESGMIRLILQGEIAPEVDLASSDFAFLERDDRWIQVRRSNLIPAIDLASIAEEATVRGEFVRDVMADTELDEETRVGVLRVGLRALAGGDLSLEMI